MSIEKSIIGGETTISESQIVKEVIEQNTAYISELVQQAYGDAQERKYTKICGTLSRIEVQVRKTRELVSSHIPINEQLNPSAYTDEQIARIIDDDEEPYFSAEERAAIQARTDARHEALGLMDLPDGARDFAEVMAEAKIKRDGIADEEGQRKVYAEMKQATLDCIEEMKKPFRPSPVAEVQFIILAYLAEHGKKVSMESEMSSENLRKVVEQVKAVAGKLDEVVESRRKAEDNK